MDDEELACFLLANPYHIKKNTNDDNLIGDIDEDIFLLLNKKFPDCTLEQNYHFEILSKIETICIEYTIKNILDSLINNIINPYESGSDE
ncbi:MAG: hypothetical protein CL904_00155 [Dehalococcoidia bacterium]|jgi:hypothetical protein|nr:hypothetical protein [Dehalococcoidia bacterium]|tara:strand:- start:1112 stop:1381 length:270 start_codon:yes stop_codon:yes gene_type:complete